MNLSFLCNFLLGQDGEVIKVKANERDRFILLDNRVHPAF